MASSAGARLDLVSAAGWRLIAAALLAALLAQIAAAPDRLASAVLLGVAILLLLLDAGRYVGRARTEPASHAAAEERRRAQQLERIEALLDAVTVALFALAPDGRIRFANRAGRALAGDAASLEGAPMLRGTAAAQILATPVGGRQLVSLADGRSALLWVGALSTPEGEAERLVSLQPVAGELDAVQVGAWHAMTRVLAHEMMNSLTPVASLSESLARLLGGEEGRPHLAAAAETIARQSRHLMGFVERYRRLADLPRPEPVALDLAIFVADLETLARAQLGDRAIAFSAAAPPDAGRVRCDPELLGQALLNLIRNAADAVEGTADAEVRLFCLRKAAAVEFRVADNGPGVSPDRIEEIFVPFFTTKPDGAGIGLTLA